MNLQRLRCVWLAPLAFFQLYLTLTVFLFFFGPWPWDVKNPITLVCYLMSAQLSIAVGYMMAWRRVGISLSQQTPAVRELAVNECLHFMRVALIITFAMFIPTSLSRTGGFFPDVVSGLQNTGGVYMENQDRLASGNTFVFAEYLRMILSPWLIAVYPIAIVYWARMSWGMRAASVLAIGANMSMYLATGTNKGLADFVVTAPWLIFMGVAAGVLHLKISKRIALVVFVAMFFGFLEFFGNSQLQRAGGVGEFGVFNTGAGMLYANSGWLSDVLTDNLRIIYESLTRYLVQGYYALSLGLQVDHGSTLGLGHSMFLARNADAIFSTTYFSEQSLPGIIESQYGWGMFSLWHSIYPWLASDFGFVGTIPVIGGLAYLLSLSWGMSLTTLRYQWLSLLFLMLVLFFYIPANNQIFQSGETCVGFFLILIGLARAKPLSSSVRPVS
ncbi:hypothetical protein [Ralstonia insidiosa]|uniref:Oligosaccharide repeat unit polymerase n=1 Tax=Ralstonia insidiosa TaxID=190721 RepID=A0A848P8U8_9RALS|nr:hypothetical protein [Ralstonia insidiosa]NMV41887.1 hypothetical protein [Ralstonia insidiosa]